MCTGASSAGGAPTVGRLQQAWTGEDYGRLSSLIVAVGSGLLQSILAATYHAEACTARQGPSAPRNSGTRYFAVHQEAPQPEMFDCETHHSFDVLAGRNPMETPQPDGNYDVHCSQDCA